MRVISCLTAALFSVLALAGARAADPPLAAYNADPTQITVSGISSGAFMAVQLGTAFSGTIKGVGVIAGGPFGCAQPSIIPGQSIMTATGPCMVGPAPSAAPLIKQAESLAQTGDIDSLTNLRGQKIYVFHGYNDATVARSVTDGTVVFYEHFLGAANRGNIFYQTAYGAGHSQVTLTAGLPCPSNETPFIDACQYDAAGKILQHLYGALNPRNAGPPMGKMLRFDQSQFTTLDPHIYSMGSTGFVYVPDVCAKQEACRLHVALHGCLQDFDDIGDKYIAQAGYNEWADTNHLIILYPQTRKIGLPGLDPFASSPLQVNPNACWDWWGYRDLTNSYMTKTGSQMAAIKAMWTAVTRGFQPVAAASPAGTAVPEGLSVSDVSDKEADLVWLPVPGATTYRVYRSTQAQGPFALAGSVAGPSFGDSALTPDRDYYWQVSAVVGGHESPHPTMVTQHTFATPPPCATPGKCAVIAH
jgi:poly(3-hydroxybutyrate) depolymerase